MPCKHCTAWRVAVYIRLSREDGNDESLSVANQRRIIRDFLERDFVGELAAVTEYVDDGVTGTDHDRPAFLRLLEDIKSGTVNCVVCKNLSRAFRNYADQGYFLEDFFPRHGVRFISLSGPTLDTHLDPESVSGYEVPISGIMNDRYAGRTSADVRRTLDMKRRNGEFIGAFAPYGYRKDPDNHHRLVVDKEAAEVVREIFDRFLRGESRRGIAQTLNELEIPNPTRYKREQGLRYRCRVGENNDGLWSARTVSLILRNRVYVGDLVQGKQRVVSYKVHDRITVPEEERFVAENTHEAIIDRHQFARAAELCAQKCQPSKTGNPNPLAGLVFCGGCGKAMARTVSRGHAYYCCRTYRDKSKTACVRRTLRADALEQAVEAVLDAGDKASEVCREKRKTAPPTENLRARREELTREERLPEKLYLDWIRGVLSDEMYRRLCADVAERTERLRRAIERMEDAAQACNAESEETKGLNRARTLACIDRILIDREGNTEVYLRGADGSPPQVLSVRMLPPVQSVPPAP